MAKVFWQNTRLQGYVDPKQIPRPILEHFPFSRELKLLGDVIGDLREEEIDKEVRIFYSLLSKDNFPIETSYAHWSKDFKNVISRSIAENCRQLPYYNFSTAEILQTARELFVDPYLLLVDIYKFPFTSMGDPTPITIPRDDPTGGMLDPYSLWFFETRGYMRPMELWQYHLMEIRKDMDDGSKILIDHMIWDTERYQDTEGGEINWERLEKDSTFFRGNPTMEDLVTSLGAQSPGAIEKFGRDYLPLIDPPKREPIRGLKGQERIDAASTWTDIDIEEKYGSPLPPAEKFITRNSMLSTFFAQIDEPLDNPPDPRFSL